MRRSRLEAEAPLERCRSGDPSRSPSQTDGLRPERTREGHASLHSRGRYTCGAPMPAIEGAVPKNTGTTCLEISILRPCLHRGRKKSFTTVGGKIGAATAETSASYLTMGGDAAHTANACLVLSKLPLRQLTTPSRYSCIHCTDPENLMSRMAFETVSLETTPTSRGWASTHSKQTLVPADSPRRQLRHSDRRGQPLLEPSCHVLMHTLRSPLLWLVHFGHSVGLCVPGRFTTDPFKSVYNVLCK